LVIWFAAVFTGIGFFVYRLFHNPLFMLITVAMVIMTIYLYWDSEKFSDKFQDARAKAAGWMKRGKTTPAPNDGVVHVVDQSPLPLCEGPQLDGKSSLHDEKLVSVGVTSVLPRPAPSTRGAQCLEQGSLIK
jgi:hypothetical protein